MQIHQITKSQLITEAGIMDYIKTIRAPQGMAGMSWDQRASTMARDSAVQNAAQAALKQWQGRAYQLLKVAGKPDPQDPTKTTVDPTEYGRQLSAFIDRVLLQGAYKYLDGASRQRVDAVQREIIAAKDNPKNLEQAFMKLLPITTTAIQTSRTTGGGYGGAAGGKKPQTAAAQQQTGQVAQPVQAVRDLWSQASSLAGRDNFAKGLYRNSGGTARSTGNAVIDDFLANSVGIRLSS